VSPAKTKDEKAGGDEQQPCQLISSAQEQRPAVPQQSHPQVPVPAEAGTEGLARPLPESLLADVKTPKKLRKWPAEHESPDPKKNFIKKHQEQQLQEQARLKEATTMAETGADATIVKKARKESGPRGVGGEDKVSESLWENLGYNSGDDIAKFGDDQLNRQPPLEPPRGKEEEEGAATGGAVDKSPKATKQETAVEAVMLPPVKAETVVVSVATKMEVDVTPNVEADAEPPSCMEQEKLQQKQHKEQQQQMVEQQQIVQHHLHHVADHHQQEQQQLVQQQELPMEPCAVLQLEQQRQQEQQLQLEEQQRQIEQHQLGQQQQQLEQQQLEQQHMEQQHQIEQQQHLDQQQMETTQQQQQYMEDMSGGYYPTPEGDAGAAQFYGGQADKADTSQSLGVYTPDSSTNSVHSMHGYPAHPG
jgi:hypothetical protein